MKTAKRTRKKVAKAPAAAKQLNVNLDYVDQIFDESIATMMAMRALIHELVAENKTLRAQLEELK